MENTNENNARKPVGHVLVEFYSDDTAETNITGTLPSYTAIGLLEEIKAKFLNRLIKETEYANKQSGSIEIVDSIN